jgi:charged multivesicular body protein 5
VYDDLEDLMDQHNEIQEIMGRSYGIQEDIDEADLDAEVWKRFFKWQ